MSAFQRSTKWVVLLILISFLTGWASNNSRKERNRLSKSKVVVEKIGSRYTSIYFPPNFKINSGIKVVYMLDGNAIFDIDPDFEKILNRLINKNIIDPIVVVGIHSTYNRTSDLVPYYDKEIIDYGGAYRPNAGLFSKEIHEVIMPYMEAKYGVSSRVDDKALFGFSHGGLFAMWEVSGNQKLWGMIASSSPSYWVKDYQVYKDIKAKGITTKKLWYDIGTGEWNVIYNLIEMLNAKGLTYGLDHFYYEDDKAEHLYGDLLERIHNPLIIFAGKQDYSPVGMKVITEFIPSRRTDRVFKRINPMIELANGVKFSASTAANYELLNKEDGGEVKSDGRFEFNESKMLHVRVSYDRFEQEIKIVPPSSKK